MSAHEGEVAFGGGIKVGSSDIDARVVVGLVSLRVVLRLFESEPRLGNVLVVLQSHLASLRKRNVACRFLCANAGKRHSRTHQQQGYIMYFIEH